LLVVCRRRRLGLHRSLLDIDELRLLRRDAQVDVPAGELLRKLESGLREQVDQAEGRGLLDRALEPPGRFDEVVATDLRELADVSLKCFDEVRCLHDVIMTSSRRLSNVNVTSA